MPLYEYECERCHEQFEVMQKFTDEPLTTHQNCGGAVHRLLSAPALQFKGSGWYITDYAKNKAADNGAAKKADASADKPAGSSDSGSSSGGSEAKAETKASSSESKSESK